MEVKLRQSETVTGDGVKIGDYKITELDSLVEAINRQGIYDDGDSYFDACWQICVIGDCIFAEILYAFPA